MKIKVGAVAPDFSLPDQEGVVRRLKDYRGQWVLLYFYPKDSTPGCTVEACAVRDAATTFHGLQLQPLGVSIDSVKSHARFAEKQKLNFPILADDNHKVVKLYGVYGKKTFMGHEYLGTRRESVLIDPKGKVFKIYSEVKPAGHVSEVIADRQSAKK